MADAKLDAPLSCRIGADTDCELATAMSDLLELVGSGRRGISHVKETLFSTDPAAFPGALLLSVTLKESD